ncbi:LamG domain-containing protein [Glutamicibacter protophormiae]|uniref:LamG domain-containing protein n=1 Tax=Glutamicibacter protophormiae TaxID=37930 RepID=UPI001958CC9F|nr:LamG domain-containing protein [Glutamicibacter protophormiae]QRQ79986.1 PKD domain-containing protein [Glutamicibacter protophormiae]
MSLLNRVTPGERRRARFSLLAFAASLSMIAAWLVAVPAAQADDDSIVLPETVSANHEPTPQINGVAWDLRVRGDVAYVVGSFTRARPSGVAAGGAGEVVRNNAMAFTISTGQILPWNPNFNAPVLDIEFSPDGNTFYTGGQFTAVGGQARSKIASFRTSDGALSGFSTSVGGHVETLAVTSDAVYAGGSFNSVGSQTRRNLAKFNRSTAALESWAPVVDDIVHGLIATDDSNRVVIGGRFQSINGQSKVGIGAVDEITGQQLPWSSTPVPARINNDNRAWVVDLKLDNGVIYAANNGMGWHWFDGRFAAKYDSGDLIWLDNCYGSTSAITVMGDVVYSTPHAHDCSSVNGFPEETPMIWKRALAETTFATGTDVTAPSNNSTVSNQPIPTLLHWYPSLNTGTYTGQYQGGWAMDHNEDYLVLGGEFTRLNETNQQGLAVFASREKSSNSLRPQYTADLKPSVISQSSGSVRIAWPTTWDYDDEVLTYEVLRDNSLTAIDTQNVSSIWWKKQSLGFRDPDVSPGSSHTYRIRVSDKWGNSYIGPRSDAVTVSNTPVSPVTTAVKDAGASSYYPLNEPSGQVAFDNIGFVDADASAALQRSVAGAIEADTATGFNGQSLATRNTMEAPNTFSVQTWFKTGSTSGGKLIGFGNAATGNSTSYDRHVWMDDSGKLYFGTWLGWAATVNSSQSYNDNEWHQMVASLGESGMSLYVDGLKVAERTDVTSGQVYSGSWRIGGDNLTGWPNRPASDYFNGTLDEVAIFDSKISDQTVLALYQASGRTADIPEPPTDAYGQAVYQDNPQFYWRLDETSGSVAKDATIAKNDGTINGAVDFGREPALPQGAALGFGAENAAVVGNLAQYNPTVFTAEAWFKTTSGNGGKIIGFGNAASGLSSSYDRHVYMRNDGTLSFGTYTGVENLATTSQAYNDGQWHHVAATLSGEGMKLYVDGALRASNPESGAEPFNGYWRVGGDRVWGGANSSWFNGDIDEAAVYSRALSQTEINEHYALVGAPNQAPTADFSVDANGLEVAFDASSSTDPDGSLLDYAWDFGDGEQQSTSTEGITHQYASAGTYTVKLIVTDDRGATAQSIQDVSVQDVNQPPVAVMSLTQNGLKVTVDGTGSTDPEAEISSYEWDFGDDSTTASGTSAEHIYTQNGQYTITLTVTDSQGATASTQSVVNVENAQPQAAISVFSENLEISVDGSGSFDPEGSTLEYRWEFGDGASADGQSAQHQYAEAGEYTLKLIVTDEHGSAGEASTTVNVQQANVAPVAAFTTTADGLDVQFDGTASTDQDGTVQSWAWDFGDGTQGTGETTEHTYAATGTYLVKLVVTDDDGANHEISTEIQVQDPDDLKPTASFTSQVDQLEVSLDASGSMPPVNGGEITGYSWDFGDGHSGDRIQTVHEYETAGTYSVSLTVTAQSGSSTLTQAVTVAAAQGPTPLLTSEVNGRMLTVDASVSSAGDAQITNYAWDFGDGQSADTMTAEHRYTADGEYTVRLTLTDGNGLQASTSTVLTVANDLPVPAFALEVDGLDVEVDAAQSQDANGEISEYLWDFGDGESGTGASASHSYAEAGDYEITLEVTDEDGGSARLTQTVTVSAAPVAQIIASDQFGRNSTNAWGAADTGGTWALNGSASNFSVANGAGWIRMSGSGSGPRLSLPVTYREADLSIKLMLDKAATGGGVYHYVTIREIPNVGSYRLKVRTLANGSVAGTFERIVGGTITALTPETTIGQVAGGPGNPVVLRLQATGTSATQLSAKVYQSGGTEPGTWQLSASDATASLQSDGRLGLGVYLSGSATNAPVLGGFDELVLKEVQ